MKKLLFVSLALVTALATSQAAKADAFLITYDLSGPCTQGGSGCANQNATTAPNGASATAASGASVGITGHVSFYAEGSGSTYFVTGGTFTIDSQSATLIVANITPGAAFYQGHWSYEVTNLITQSGFYGTDQTVPSNLTGANAVFFDNLLTPGGSPILTGDGISFLVSGYGDNPNGGPAVFNIFSNGQGLYWNEVINGAWLIDPTGIGGDPLTMTLIDNTPVPEPSSLLMLGAGLLLMAGVLFRKLKPVTV